MIRGDLDVDLTWKNMLKAIGIAVVTALILTAPLWLI